MENGLLKDKTPKMIASAVREKKVQWKSCDKMLQSVESKCAGLVTKVPLVHWRMVCSRGI